MKRSYRVIFLAWFFILYSCNVQLVGNAFQYHLYKNSEVYKMIHGDSGDKTDQTETYSAEADKGDEETYSDNRQQMEAEQTDSSYSSDYDTEPQETMNSWKSHGN
jgi:hypothetical protein